ncbi:MAG: hypothetical protein J6I42_06225, partial [Clostridia bacterium]|nr:hypothetical protein [Clostridia bacterium]
WNNPGCRPHLSGYTEREIFVEGRALLVTAAMENIASTFAYRCAVSSSPYIISPRLPFVKRFLKVFFGKFQKNRGGEFLPD